MEEILILQTEGQWWYILWYQCYEILRNLAIQRLAGQEKNFALAALGLWDCFTIIQARCYGDIIEIFSYLSNRIHIDFDISTQFSDVLIKTARRIEYRTSISLLVMITDWSPTLIDVSDILLSSSRVIIIRSSVFSSFNLKKVSLIHIPIFATQASIRDKASYLDVTSDSLNAIYSRVSSVYRLTHHDDVIKWKHFPRYWPFVRGIHRSRWENSLHKGQWRGALMFSLICTRIKGWVNNGEAGDLRRYRAHYDVTVMMPLDNFARRSCVDCEKYWETEKVDPICTDWTRHFEYDKNILEDLPLFHNMYWSFL